MYCAARPVEWVTRTDRQYWQPVSAGTRGCSAGLGKSYFPRLPTASVATAVVAKAGLVRRNLREKRRSVMVMSDDSGSMDMPVRQLQFSPRFRSMERAWC